MQLSQRPADYVLRELRRFILEGIERGSFTQSSLATKAGVSQPNVSRILSNKGRCRIGRAVRALCSYAGVELEHGVAEQDDPADAELVNALNEVWDGSATHAKNLAKMIRAVGPLCR